MKKQHKKPEFTVLKIDEVNQKFFMASNPNNGRVQFAGRLNPNQESDITSGVPSNGAAGYEVSSDNFNW